MIRRQRTGTRYDEDSVLIWWVLRSKWWIHGQKRGLFAYCMDEELIDSLLFQFYIVIVVISSSFVGGTFLERASFQRYASYLCICV